MSTGVVYGYVTESAGQFLNQVVAEATTHVVGLIRIADLVCLIRGNGAVDVATFVRSDRSTRPRPTR
jgi:hypothetical protein